MPLGEPVAPFKNNPAKRRKGTKGQRIQGRIPSGRSINIGGRQRIQELSIINQVFKFLVPARPQAPDIILPQAEPGNLKGVAIIPGSIS